ncbi:MAG: AMP-binding protein [Acidimicrobiales bacterium]
MPNPTEEFRAARDQLLDLREDYEAARSRFAWPRPATFNFARDWFDAVLAHETPDQPGLVVIEEDGSATSYSFAELSTRSRQLASWLRDQGVSPGMRVLVLLGNQVELWEVTLAILQLGAVMIPATTLLTSSDLQDRIDRASAGAVIAQADVTARFANVSGSYVRVSVGGAPAGWLDFADARQASADFVPAAPTAADDPFLIYFTSGTTALPKMVGHTHASYPMGHLSTMYWIGIRPGDVHLNVSSPGWAKHAWSSMFAPWIAGATIAVYNYARFDAAAMLQVLVDQHVTTFCAPPTVWRMLIQQDLAHYATSLRELASAGEPLNAEVIEAVQRAWGMTIRDGFGQTETTVQIGNSPGQPVIAGSMGRPIPGYTIELVDPISGEVGDDGEICVSLADERPLGLMTGYRTSTGADDARNAAAFAGGRYHTGDIAHRDESGYITYVGRSDDVFKASDYRISPFELESVLIEHPAVAEAAVVPAPDAMRLAVPKAFVSLVAGYEPSPELARDILAYSRDHLAPYKRVRRLEFAELPKTISGKIRRVDLRTAEQAREGRAPAEYREEDFA